MFSHTVMLNHLYMVCGCFYGKIKRPHDPQSPKFSLSGPLQRFAGSRRMLLKLTHTYESPVGARLVSLKVFMSNQFSGSVSSDGLWVHV